MECNFWGYKLPIEVEKGKKYLKRRISVSKYSDKLKF